MQKKLAMTKDELFDAQQERIAEAARRGKDYRDVVWDKDGEFAYYDED